MVQSLLQICGILLTNQTLYHFCKIKRSTDASDAELTQQMLSEQHCTKKASGSALSLQKGTLALVSTTSVP
jgi:hypothetical protein